MNKWLWMFLLVITLAGGTTFWVFSNKGTENPKTALQKKHAPTDEYDAPAPSEAAIGGGSFYPPTHDDEAGEDTRSRYPHPDDHLGARNPVPKYPSDPREMAQQPPPGADPGGYDNFGDGDDVPPPPVPGAPGYANQAPNGQYDPAMPPPNYNYPPPNYPEGGGTTADNLPPPPDYDGGGGAGEDYVAPDPRDANPGAEPDLPGAPPEEYGGY